MLPINNKIIKKKLYLPAPNASLKGPYFTKKGPCLCCIVVSVCRFNCDFEKLDIGIY